MLHSNVLKQFHKGKNFLKFTSTSKYLKFVFSSSASLQPNGASFAYQNSKLQNKDLNSYQTKVKLRDDITLHGWPGTMGGIAQRTNKATESSDRIKILSQENDISLLNQINKSGQWNEFNSWYKDIVDSLKTFKPENVSPDLTRGDNDISLLPEGEVTKQAILTAFEATTRSDPITHKRRIANPEIEMTTDPGIVLTYVCEKCKKTQDAELSIDELLQNSRRESDGKSIYVSSNPCNCKNCTTNNHFLVVRGSRTVLNWYKVLITLNNDLKRMRDFVFKNTNHLDGVVHKSSKNNDNLFRGPVNIDDLDKDLIEDLIIGMHNQYKRGMFSIIMSVSDDGKPLEIPQSYQPLKNLLQHWEPKRHTMTDLWWKKVKDMLEREHALTCDKTDCAICTRYSGEDWHDVAPHIGQCDFYGRFHAGTDIVALSWIERMMITASYWDELGNKDQVEVEKAKKSIGRSCIDVFFGRDKDFDQRMSKMRCLLNLNTYTLRRALVESRYRAENGLGSFAVGKFENLADMIRGRLFEGMTLPYVEDDMMRRSCTNCADVIVLAGQLGIVFHDAIDLPNDVFNGEYMNVYRMAASGGYEELMRFTRGTCTLLKAISSVGTECLCCKNVLQAAIANSVSWYFYCARYNYPSNVQHVYKLEAPESTEIDVEAAHWVGKLLGANEKTLEMIKKWADLPIVSHDKWGCGNSNPKQRFTHMRKAVFDNEFADLDLAEQESAEVFCNLALSGQKHISGHKDNCLCCEVGYECIEMSVVGDMIGRFVYHALRLSRGRIDMVIDN